MASMAIIHPWNPEDSGFWRGVGRSVARRNLWLAVPALTLAFVVWMLWSVLVVQLPAAGFHYSNNQLFWLTALPALCGATLRIFYALAVPLVGGRRFTTWATLSLLLPLLGIGWAVQDPSTPYEYMVVLALLCGLGGGNFASTMAHLNFLFPVARKGYALGLVAGLGHLGVAGVQVVVPWVIAVGVLGPWAGAPQLSAQGPLWLQNAAFVWVPLIVASAAAAWFGMDDLPDVARSAKAGFAAQAAIVTHKHNWLMCWLYLGSFGSFIGLAAGLPMLIQSQFQREELVQLAWFGPLIGALLRPLGGCWADRHGGARITFWSFVLMALGAGLVLGCLPSAQQAGSFGGFLAGFGVLFAAAGVANGSTFRMVTTLFLSERQRAAEPLPSAQTQATLDGNVAAAAVLGFASAIGAYGGFFIPKSYGTAIALTGSPAAALQLFLLFYASCIALTWWYYSRRNAPHPC
jgi:MFS transporter, NNP family, nitrate/nitrite transporter